MKYAAIFFLLFGSAITKSAELIHWEGLVYDYTNADAYHIKINKDNIEYGLIGVTTQLYSYGGGKYVIIPKNMGVSVKRFLTTDKLNLGIGFSYWINESIIFTDKLNYQIIVNYRLKDNVELQFQHYGLTSVTKSDLGLNKVSFLVTF